MASAPTPLVIRSLRAGMNNTDSPLSLPEDQCVLAQNVEWTVSQLGERRLGSDAITLPASISGKDRITFLHRHLPTSDETAAQLWVLGVTGTSSSQIAYKDTSWHDVTASDTVTLTGFSQYQWAGQSLHGKLFLAYDSDVDRLHVWDGTSLRRTGLAEPAAPTGANTGSGTFSGTRYYRVRYIDKPSSTILRRSEPSDALTFAPSGSGTGIIVTKPTTISEGETHWELEASTGGVEFYLIATTAVGTSTVTDSTAFTTDYTAFPLSDDIGDYTLLPSARYLAADQDRLLMAGSWEDAAQASRVTWTPVYGNLGAGNDERQEADTDPYLDLDGFEGGPITGMSAPVLGGIWVFKQSHIYKLVRSGARRAAYQAFPYTKKRGALHGSVVEGYDQSGNPCIYFLDPTIGPCRVGGPTGIQPCGSDIATSWASINLDASKAVATAWYHPFKQQVHWAIATGSSNLPDVHIVLHTSEIRNGDDGARNGWALWTGPTAGALTACLFADNIESGAARSRTLVPFVGLEGSGLVQMTETGNDDNGTSFEASIITKPYTPANIINAFGIQNGVLVGKAVAGAVLDVTATRDFGLESITVTDIAFDPVGSETLVIVPMDNLSFSELHAFQIEFTDQTPPGSRWELQMLALKPRGEKTS